MIPSVPPTEFRVIQTVRRAVVCKIVHLCVRRAFTLTVRDEYEIDFALKIGGKNFWREAGRTYEFD
jgi:hypothetical protein